MWRKRTLSLGSLVLQLFGLLLLASPVAGASPGTGIDTAKVQLPGLLEPAITYSLPSITVYNTGDETAEYEMAVTLNERQPELKPGYKWVSFSPSRFTIPPQGAQTVTISMALPDNVKAGNYYSYLEAHTISTSGQESHISAAAAAKFYFSAEGALPALPRSTKSEITDKPESKDAADVTLASVLAKYSYVNKAGSDVGPGASKD